ncbi:DUF2283 domain-containing protein [Exiguobacterium sp. 22311]|uniref:DUF2283 domain-containing protein n=1 Tax=Exiguobacterium sp. 22311 TaxID=3453907 RepID=UPI003F835EF6
MSIKITLDKKLELGYLYLFPKSFKYKIEDTEELEDNPHLSLDIDQDERIIGIEVFDSETIHLHDVINKEVYYEEKPDHISLRLKNILIKSTSTFSGIRFHFAEEDYSGFVGFDIIDLELYSKESLKPLIK